MGLSKDSMNILLAALEEEFSSGDAERQRNAFNGLFRVIRQLATERPARYSETAHGSGRSVAYDVGERGPESELTRLVDDLVSGGMSPTQAVLEAGKRADLVELDELWRLSLASMRHDLLPSWLKSRFLAVATKIGLDTIDPRSPDPAERPGYDETHKPGASQRAYESAPRPAGAPGRRIEPVDRPDGVKVLKPAQPQDV